jgi:predicted ATP-dependent endonuclease of OLD family
MILVMSENLNIQVFATTHSNDCIAALTEVLQQEKHSESGAIFRLQRTSSGKHIAVKFVSSELNTAREHGIEIR